MSVETLPWDDLRLVLAVAEGRGLAPAGTRLGLNGSTVFRRLGQIEERLGTPLFERHRSGYVPTPAGAAIAETARRMDDDVAALSLRIAGHASLPSGEVRVTTNDGLIGLMVPIFGRFRAAHPAITLDVLIGNEPVNLARRAADVAVRATAGVPPDTLVGRRVATLNWALYAADGMRETAGSNWVTLGGDLASVPAARLTRERTERVVFKLSTVLGLAEAVSAGIGIGFLPCFLADREPGLARLGEPLPELSGSLWLLTHPDLRSTPRVRAVLDFLGAELTRVRASLAGER